MTAPTHIAFAVAVALIGGADPKTSGALIAAGSLLPDIDHPQSAIGRILFFLSYPLNRIFGHRNFIHSLILWLPLTLIGFLFWSPLGWACLGAISHILIDCLNVSGVALLNPVTEKIFVLAGQKYRISTGSRNEFILMVALTFIAYGSGYVNSKGGLRKLFSAFLGNYEMAVEQYLREGTKICYMEGKLRYPDGSIEQGKWLILGTNKAKGSLTLYDEKIKKILYIPTHATFLKATLNPTDNKWQTLKLYEPAELKEGTAYFNPSEKWHIAKQGDTLWGYVIYEGKIGISPM